VPAEEITAYEIGLKSDFFEHRLRVNLAGFINDYSPRVTSRFGYSCNLANDTTPGPYFPPGPAAQACPAGTPMAGLPGWLWFSPFSAPGKDKGLELEVTAQPVRNLLINASAGYLKFVSGAPPGSDGYVDPSVREQPRLSYSVGAQYDINLGQGGSITPRFDLFYQGERTNGTVSQVQVSPDNIVPSYTLVNARLTYTSPDAKWTAALSAENLLNKFYWAQLVSATDAAGAQTFNRTGVPGRPREVAVTLRHNF
jgi:iron complex outermembrane receptor protein